MMAEIDEEYDISDAVTSLGKLLRYSMKWVSGNVLVEQELEYIKNYMALINLRFDYEIYLSLNLPEIILQQEIPKMSLQPIVENAIYHGIEQMAEDTNIYIKGRVEGNDCVIEITDAGRGMTEEEMAQLRQKIAGELDSSGGSGNGIGLKKRAGPDPDCIWRGVWHRSGVADRMLYQNYRPHSDDAQGRSRMKTVLIVEDEKLIPAGTPQDDSAERCPGGSDYGM